jgi:hypothetical protein
MDRLVWRDAWRMGVKLLALAAICYGVYHRWAVDGGREIEVTVQMTGQIAEAAEELVGRPLTTGEIELAVADFVDEEILVREAFRQGLDRGDRRVRPMLIEHARSELLRAAGYEPSEPTEDMLRAYYVEHRQRYGIPERIDVEQVLFLPGSEQFSSDSVLEELSEGADFKRMGDGGRLNASVKGVSRAQMARAYGLDFTNAVFALAKGDWHGPLSSTAGAHFVRIVAVSPSEERSYDDVAEYVREDYALSDAERVVAREIERIGKRYRVEMPRGDEDAK